MKAALLKDEYRSLLGSIVQDYRELIDQLFETPYELESIRFLIEDVKTPEGAFFIDVTNTTAPGKYMIQMNGKVKKSYSDWKRTPCVSKYSQKGITIYAEVIEKNRELKKVLNSLMLSYFRHLFSNRYANKRIDGKLEQMSPTKAINNKLLINEAVFEYFDRFCRIDLTMLNELSCEKYEGRNKRSVIAFCPIGEEEKKKRFQYLLKFETPFSLGGIRQNRKILELSSVQNPVVAIYNKNSHQYDMEGIACSKTYYRKIDLIGRLAWEYQLDGFVLKYDRGKHVIIDEKKKNKEEDSYQDIYRALLTSKPDEDKKIGNLIKQAKNQEHGTCLIIGQPEKIEREVDRLTYRKRGIKISPRKLTNNLIKAVSAVDGAFFVGTDGYCYGFGIILDGAAKVNGTPERGARYNSVRTYIYDQWKSEKNRSKGVLVGIIISEDRTLDYCISGKEPVSLGKFE